MYKDKDKQREAVRKAVQRHRVLHKGIAKVLHKEGITSGITSNSKGITLDKVIEIKKANRISHHPACKCKVCQEN